MNYILPYKKIKIVGAGPTGSLLALALANLNIKIYLYDKEPYKNIVNKDKTYAITQSSYNFFKEINIWSELVSSLQEFNKLIVRDNIINEEINFNIKDIYKDNKDCQALGWIIEHTKLMECIANRIHNQKNIQFIQSVEGINELDEFDLCISADGFNSKAKKLCSGLSFSNVYDQACISFKVLLRGINDTTAMEIFCKDGPLAILPLGKNFYQIIWTSSHAICHKRIQYRYSQLLDELARFLPGGVEADYIVNSPKIFNTALSITLFINKKRQLLIGESFHCVHPVGGQGLNLSIRDISDLYHIIRNLRSKNLTYNNVSFKYQLYRLPDIISVAFSTHSLLKFFSNDYLIFIYFRKLVMKLIRKSRLIKKLILSQMTYGFLKFN
ncbi:MULTISPECIES: FAD-dependent monooxygenase [Prochlorococcus]|uniref:FAD-dependent monooxygenase n=1 Tax=Prochlorococcus TaxID=1218 RepID=UPI0005339125|nr:MULTISPECIES: FAD-dependent monooxygenase [Prochlorococcus]KGG12412.1 2-octaprenyl-6-methoxyphenol hydroxylase [Prochlorococcus sp. MIT 0601]